MPSTLLRAPLACRKCGAPLDVGAKASLLGSGARIALDLACGGCGHRALYSAA